MTVSFSIIGTFLYQRISDDKSIQISKDKWIGKTVDYRMPRLLQDELNSRQLIQHILHWIKYGSLAMRWDSWERMGEVAKQCTVFRAHLIIAGIKLRNKEDILLRDTNPIKGTYSVRLGYGTLFRPIATNEMQWWCTSIWKVKVPPKTRHFS